jgi:hypothetical protein
MMKNIILKFSLILVIGIYTNSSNAQIIVDMAGDNNTYPSGYLSTGQYYIKDVNNHLDNFTGTWEYINGNEKFQIVLTKMEYYHVVKPNIQLNHYEDGIVLQYRKYVNNVLTFESPIYEDPNFRTEDGVVLTGHLSDYGRITKTVYYPLTTMVRAQGGEPIYPHCRISKELTHPSQPPKIFFNLELIDVVNYDTETYAGQPTFSIPNNIVMTKID